MSKQNRIFANIQEQYNEQAERRKDKIRNTTSKFKRFWMWLWYLISFPFVWLFYNVRDWRSLICVIVSLLLWSSSVWIFYLLAILTGWTTDTAKWFIGIGTAVWIWWASPIGSPFILLVTFTAIGMKMLFDKFRNKKNVKRKN